MICITGLVTLLLSLTHFGLVNTQAITKLKCEQGERQLFKYESDTKLWGPVAEGIKITADVRVYCMGKDDLSPKESSDSLKYMVEVANLNAKRKGSSDDSQRSRRQRIRFPDPRRTRRGAGDFFKDAWDTVKKFFVKVFTKSKGRESNTQDIEAEFDQLPKPGSSSRQCQKDKQSSRRSKRAPTAGQGPFESELGLPFQFVQNLNGQIVDVRFSVQEKDETVKNFKKHLADTFATQLFVTNNRTMETSPLGQHMTRYVFDKNNVQEVLKHAESGFAKLIRRLFQSKTVQAQTAPTADFQIVRDFSDKDMMKIGGDKEVIYDPSQLNIEVQQIQEISEGHMTKTVGHLSLKLAVKDEQDDDGQERNSGGVKRNKRSSDGNNLSAMMNVETQYSMKMISRRRKRSSSSDEMSATLKQLKETESKLNFKSESLVSKSSQEKMLGERLEALRSEVGKAFASVTSNNDNKDLLRFLHNGKSPVYNKLSEVLDLEQLLSKSSEPDSFSSAIRSAVTRQSLVDKCGQPSSLDYNSCDDLLIVLSRAGSTVSANYLLDALESETKSSRKSNMLKILIHINDISGETLKRLFNVYDRNSDDGQSQNEDFKGQLLMVITLIASKKTTSASSREMVKVKLMTLLDSIKCDTTPRETDRLLDILDATGNLNDVDMISNILDVARRCITSEVHQVATIHALKSMVQDTRVQKWYKEVLIKNRYTCQSKRAIIASLEKFITSLDPPTLSWSKKGLNTLDQVLLKLSQEKNTTQCDLSESIKNYFKLQKSPKALSEKPESIENVRQKRSLFQNFWDESSCNDFTKGQEGGSVDVPVVSDKEARFRETEEVDTQFTKRRKCSARKSFGPKGAQARISADIVNDITGSKESPDYKLLARLAFGSHFLGKDIDVGKLFWKQDKESSRAYVNIFGQTLLDKLHKRCDPDSVKPYRYTTYVPLYDFTVWLIEVNLGIRLDGQMSFQQSDCRRARSDSNDVLVAPAAAVKAAGEASAKVLIFKGGLDVSGDFNYFSEIRYKPDPELCLSAYNGHDPMNVSVEPWFQMWDFGCNEWSQRMAWRPKNLNWGLDAKEKSAWIQDECLLQKGEGRSGQIARHDP